MGQIDPGKFLERDFDNFISMADDWSSVATTASGHVDTLDDSVKSHLNEGDHWSGRAAKDARKLLKKLRTRMDDCSGEADGMATVIKDIGERWKGVQKNIKGIIQELEKDGLSFDKVEGDYEVYSTSIGQTTSSSSATAADRRNQTADEWSEEHGKDYVDTCNGYLEDIADQLDEAEQIDEDFSWILQYSFTSQDPDSPQFHGEPETDPDSTDMPDDVDYTFDYSFEDCDYGPEYVTGFAAQHFSDYFPFKCEPEGSIQVGDEVKLSLPEFPTPPFAGQDNGVKVEKITDNYIQLVAMPGHVEGDDRHIRFTFDNVDGKTQMNVSAWGPDTVASEVTGKGGLAMNIWEQYAKLLAGGLNDSSQLTALCTSSI